MFTSKITLSLSRRNTQLLKPYLFCVVERFEKEEKLRVGIKEEGEKEKKGFDEEIDKNFY